MAAWIVCALCALVIIKPQEFVPSLAGLPLLYIAFGVAVLCVVLDVVWRRLKPTLAPQVPFVVAFLLWALLVTALKRPEVVGERALFYAVTLAIFLVVAVGAASSRGVLALGVTLVACAALVSTVAIVQGFSPYTCMIADPDDWQGRGELEPDGRPCETDLDCRQDAPDPDANYRCERAGPLKTSTIRGRVRYRGSLADPNELSLMAGVSIPFALALVDRRARRRRGEDEAGRPSRPSKPRVRLPLLLTDGLLGKLFALVRSIPAAVLIGVVGVMVVMSRSRSGLLVYLIVLGVYFIRRMGAWGLVAGCLVGPPMIVFGGRSGSEAEESADERVDLLHEAFQMIRDTKGIGVGAGLFADESSLGLTAHNAYLLAAAEVGLVGMCLFGLVLYASVKVPLAIWFGDYRVDTTIARFAPAIFVAHCGALAGIFFLSWTYKDILYMVVGASAALYGAARAQDDRLSLRISGKEIALVCGGMFCLLVVLNVFLRIRT